jgi:hypothetical protein
MRRYRLHALPNDISYTRGRFRAVSTRAGGGRTWERCEMQSRRDRFVGNCMDYDRTGMVWKPLRQGASAPLCVRAGLTSTACDAAAARCNVNRMLPVKHLVTVPARGDGEGGRERTRRTPCNLLRRGWAVDPIPLSRPSAQGGDGASRIARVIGGDVAVPGGGSDLLIENVLNLAAHFAIYGDLHR